VPAASGRHGGAYLGFDDSWAQGGLNTEGLAFDWVAGYNDTWTPDPGLPRVRGNGNSSQLMLETCATIEDAITFYRTHLEAGFFRARILVADRAGNPVIIGARHGGRRGPGR